MRPGLLRARELQMKCSLRLGTTGISQFVSDFRQQHIPLPFVALLKDCTKKNDLQKGIRLHARIVGTGILEKDPYVVSTLVNMYAKCGDLIKAQEVFDDLPFRDLVAWNVLISGYSHKGFGTEALLCFKHMRCEGLLPTTVTFICLLKACASIGATQEGKQIHDEILGLGLLGESIVLGNALIDMYARFGMLEKSMQVFDELPARDVASWNALIGGYAQQARDKDALDCFDQMRCHGITPDAITYVCILKACGSIGAYKKCQDIHNEIVSHGLLKQNVVLGTALVDMHVKCGALAKAAQLLFDLPIRNVVSWSALIIGFSQEEKGEEALEVFERMQHEGLTPDAVTYICILKACGCVGALEKGKQIHDEIIAQGLLSTDFVLGTSLVDMYAKCGAVSKAHKVLEELPVRDVVSWNALITGYAQDVQGEHAANCLEQMQCEGLPPDVGTFTSLLNVCSRSGLMHLGRTYLDDMSTRYKCLPDIVHYSCMVDLFGRTGHFEKAISVLKKLPSSDVSVVSSALLGACGKWGNVKLGRWVFDCMLHSDKGGAAAYICMANIYTALAMHDDADKIEAMRFRNTVRKENSCRLPNANFV